MEPVVTDNLDLLKQSYADMAELYKPYNDKTNSVQRFADNINPYGTYIINIDDKNKEWVGCPLLVHRRCISPMFEISNCISYDNIMKKQTVQPNTKKEETFIYKKSQWININGKEEGFKNHFIKEQGDVVIKMLENAFSKNSNPDIFIITPFKSVETGFKEYINKYIKNIKKNEKNFLSKYESFLNDLMKKNIGTVHKFQGREAEEVIFLLGCDNSDNTKGTIKWVNSNIVNVAVTRAKYRIYIVGDAEARKESKYVKVAKEILDLYNAEKL